MAYRACFQCELLFEVDDDPALASATCPQCGGALEPYVPEDEDELDPPDDSILDLPTMVGEGLADQAIVKTMTVEGLSERVRERAARRGASSVPGIDDTGAPGLPTGALPPAAARPAPPRAAVASPAPASPPQAEPSAAQRPLAPFGQRAAPAAPAPVGGGGSHAELAARAGRTRVLPAVGEPGGLGAGFDDLVPPVPRPSMVAAAPIPAAPIPAAPIPAAPIPAGPSPVPVAAVPTDNGRSRRTGAGHAAIPSDDAAVAPTAPRRRKRWPKVLLVMVLLGGAGGGGWYWWTYLRTPPAPPPPPVTTRSEPKTWSERIERQLADGQGRLPMVSGVGAAEEGGPYVAGGPEGLSTSAGPIHGMPRTEVGRNIIKADGEGEWVEPFVAALDREKVEPTLTLSFAVDVSMTTGDLLRLAYAGLKHGHQRFALVVARPEGTLGSLPFGLHPKGRPVALGETQVVVRIGQRGFLVTAEKDGEVVSTGERQVQRRANGDVDLKGLGERLAELLADHADARRVLIHPLRDLPTGQLAEILTTIRGGDQSPRFPDMRLALP